MRLLIAMMKHETNTFSPVPTPICRFGRGYGLYYGEEAIEAYRGTGSAIGAYLDLAAECRAEIVVPVAAEAWPSGPVEDAAFDRIAGAICEQVERGGFDGILLDLHGAMVTESVEDGEGELLRRIRAIDRTTPIAVALDMHANLYDEMIVNATVVAGYRTYPHVDTYETGRRAGDLLLRALRGEISPVVAWGNAPMLPHIMRQGTSDHPNKELQRRCVEMSGGPALDASLFMGFPHADIRNAGLSAVVVADGDREVAERLRDDLLRAAWNARADFLYEPEPLLQSMDCAKAVGTSQHDGGPIILLDHCDNSSSGGTMDTTAVLAEVMRQDLENVAVFAIRDPEAVRQAIGAGIGATVTLSLGGKMRMPSLPVSSPPLTVTGAVKTISMGRFRNKGPREPGLFMNMGTSVVVDTGKVEIVIVSQHQEPYDVNCLLSLGIDPMQKRYLMLKSRVHWRAGFGAMAKAVVECAGIGVCTSDYGQLSFSKVRRPIYPLDDV
jgi:microcystin degradation protein MlrC